MSSYVNNTDPSPYDQLIALSQKTINKSFEYMWQEAQLDDNSNPLKHFKETLFTPLNCLDTDIGAPQVRLQVTTTDPMLYFLLSMTSGTLQLSPTGTSNDPNNINWTINDWVFAFSVRISSKKIDKDSDEYKKFGDRAGLPDSDFSLQKLFIDASSTTNWDPSLSSFGDKQTDYDNLSPFMKEMFVSFVSLWLNQMSGAGKDVLGYSAQRQDYGDELNPYVPSFPPTSIDYCCYPWPDQNGTDNNPLAALCYLMMSNFKTPPVRGAIPYSGQFVDEDHDATYCMHRDLFWEGWMHSVLLKVIRGLMVVPLKPISYYDSSEPKTPFVAGPNFTFGDDGGNYYFQRNPDGGWDWIGRPLWTQNSTSKPGDYKDWEMVEEWSNSPHRDVDIDAAPKGGHLSYSAGETGGLITLTGSYSFIFYVNHKDYHDYNMVFQITWKIQIGIASIEDGGLKFQLVGDPTVDVEPSSWGPLQWGGNPKAFAAQICENLQDNLNTTLQSLEDQLLLALANQHRLFLPGKGSFLFKDGIFNENGDLLVTLTYNGADPPPSPNSKVSG